MSGTFSTRSRLASSSTDMEKIEFITRPLLEPSERMDGFMRFVKAFEIRYRGAVYTVPAGFETDGASIPDFAKVTVSGAKLVPALGNAGSEGARYWTSVTDGLAST